MKGKKSAVLVLAATALLAVGCGLSKGSNEGGSESVSGDEIITLRVMDWSDNINLWRKPFHDSYQEKVNPKVKIEYTMMTQDQFKNTIVALINSGDAPDLFPVPVGMKLPTAVAEGWLQPINPYVTEEFLNRFEPVALTEGNTKIGDDVYCPANQVNNPGTLFFYNKDILVEAGLEPPRTYSEFLAACKKITEKGAGRYYGLIDGGKQTSRLEMMVRTLTNMAGGKAGSYALVNTVNGRAPFDSPEMIGVFRFLEQLQKDGSIHPDTMSINALEARALFAEGQAAFICQGPYCVNVWLRNNPGLNFGVMAPPVPDSAARGYIPEAEEGAYLGIYAKSKHPKEAGEYLMNLRSEAFEGPMVADGGIISVLKGINDKYLTNPQLREFYEVGRTVSIPSPIATHRSADVNNFYSEVKDVNPNLGAIAQGVMAGSIKDYQAALKGLADKSTAEWKRACEVVGLDYSVFEFPNWDPLKPYTDDDYAALPKL
ncbi:MAG: extracellular solute-binding protein [Treponema sp.]|jgi:ABC-type glycerol-3-phosphate transport system substrate-binding protein|nr:extracellular solute-binding protein [Treponema sp.]